MGVDVSVQTLLCLQQENNTYLRGKGRGFRPALPWTRGALRIVSKRSLYSGLDSSTCQPWQKAHKVVSRVKAGNQEEVLTPLGPEGGCKASVPASHTHALCVVNSLVRASLGQTQLLGFESWL